jgi:hypothetical protein
MVASNNKANQIGAFLSYTEGSMMLDQVCTELVQKLIDRDYAGHDETMHFPRMQSMLWIALLRGSLQDMMMLIADFKKTDSQVDLSSELNLFFNQSRALL